MAKTRPCTKCGEVLFKINPVCENTEVICQACNHIMYINSGEFTTYEKMCKSCSNELFKLKRHEYGEKEITKIECTNCKDEPNTYYIDKDGNSIDRPMREILLIKDNIEKVGSDVYNIEYRIDSIDNKMDYMESNIRNLNIKANRNEEYINDIECEVRYIKSDIRSIENSIRELKNNVESLDGAVLSKSI